MSHLQTNRYILELISTTGQVLTRHPHRKTSAIELKVDYRCNKIEFTTVIPLRQNKQKLKKKMKNDSAMVVFIVYRETSVANFSRSLSTFLFLILQKNTINFFCFIEAFQSPHNNRQSLVILRFSNIAISISILFDEWYKEN